MEGTPGQDPAFIRSAFHLDPSGKKNAGSIAVLGSGWLLDVPLDHLCSGLEQVYLVDINHPPQIRKKAERLDNVDPAGGGSERRSH